MSTMLTPFAAFETLWNRLAPTGALTEAERDAQANFTVQPRIDIHESDSEFVIEADLPGVSKENLRVEVEKNRLTISGTRTTEERKHDPIHVERYTKATMVRSFTLGTDVNPDGIKAQLKDGVLILTLPKVEQALPRRIEVR
jgi:HSP20 family protein